MTTIQKVLRKTTALLLVVMLLSTLTPVMVGVAETAEAEQLIVENDAAMVSEESNSPEPSQEPEVTPQATAEPTASPEVTAAPEPTPEATASPEPTAVPTITPRPSATPRPTATPTPNNQNTETTKRPGLPASFSNYDPVAGTIQYRRDTEPMPYQLIDRLSFDLTLDTSYRGTDIWNISNIRSEVHCTLTHIWKNYQIFILTLEGVGGKLEYYYIYDGGFTSFAEKHSFMDFFTINPIIDGDFYQILNYYSNNPLGVFKIYGQGDGKTFTDVQFSFEKNGIQSKRIDAEKVKYEIITNDPDDLSSTIYAYLTNEKPKVTLNQETEKEEQKEQAEPQPVEALGNNLYQTKLRKKTADTDLDFYIDLVTRFTLNTSDLQATDWMEELGAEKSAEVTFINIVTTHNGKDNLNYPMVKIKGHKGERWFRLSSVMFQDEEGIIIQGTKPVGENAVRMYLNSCVSFDGLTIISNDKEYETISVRLVYTDENKRELKAMEVDFDDTQTLIQSSENMNHIGDSQQVFERWSKGGI